MSIEMSSEQAKQFLTFQIDDTYYTWTNMIVKMTILRLLGSSDDKEKIGGGMENAMQKDAW